MSALNPFFSPLLLPAVLFLLTFLSSPPLASSDPAVCNKADEAVLLKIKRHFGNPPSLATWDPSTDCCKDWEGVTCSYEDGRVIFLSFHNTTISGPIPPQLGDLPDLYSISFYNNPNLTGPIPASLANLTYFSDLTISGTSLSGPIPSFLCQIPRIYSIDLSWNRLTGSIPGCFGSRPLLEIDFSHNQLSGPIPPSFMYNVSNGDQLSLNDNQLTGQIPRTLAAMIFYGVNLSRNRFTGDASFLFGEHKDIKHIDLSSNDLDFDLSNVSFPLRLRSLDLSHDRITGTISRQISKLGQLQSVNVSYNRLCGPIPTAGMIKQFDESAYEHNKCLCGGPLPPCGHASGRK